MQKYAVWYFLTACCTDIMLFGTGMTVWCAEICCLVLSNCLLYRYNVVWYQNDCLVCRNISRDVSTAILYERWRQAPVWPGVSNLDLVYAKVLRQTFLTAYISVISCWILFILQSTLVISKSKGPSKTVRDIRTSTYQICSIEEKTI